MTAIDNKHLIEVISIQESSGVSQKTGRPWVRYRAQCVITGGEAGAQVGRLTLQESLKDTPAGKYLAEVEMRVDPFTLDVVPLVVQLHPHGAGARPQAKPATQAPVPA